MSKKKLFPGDKRPAKEEIPTVFDQYKLAVDMWDRVRARRQDSNKFYLSINTAIVGATALSPLGFSSLGLAVVGIIVCILWTVNILNYRSLTNDKHDVIVDIEELFPSAPFSAEGSGSRHFTRIERCIPATFGLLYALMVLSHTATGSQWQEQIKNTLASL
jgi:hypothetical protein